MKRVFLIAIMLLTISIAYSQIDVRDIIKRRTEQRAERRAGQGVEKGLDKIEEGVVEMVGGNKKEDKVKKEPKDPNNSESLNEEARPANDPSNEVTTNSGSLPWTKYDFVPGDVIIFEDDLKDEENGEFPSKWDLVKGTTEVAEFNGENVIRFSHNNYGSTITPLMTNEGDYLPDKFTIEFDAYYSDRTTEYKVTFWDLRKSKPAEAGSIQYVEFGHEHRGSYKGGQISQYLEKGNQLPYPHWRHIAISFNIRSLKLYADETRVLNIPNIQGNPTGISIQGSTYDFGATGNYPTVIKNIRIAKGAKKLYDRIHTDGKIICHGIRFDFGKATIKPESMGEINRIYKFLQKYPDVKFSVEGHTDNVGEDDSNQKLSEERSSSVMKKLVDMGISKNRLQSKGWGESRPLDLNDTPEGKANNRRVEFVKI